MPSISSAFQLSNGVKIPCVGLGTWQITDEKLLCSTIENALSLGCRHIDTAHIYGNEKAIGRAVKNCGIPRSSLFITTKMWNTDRGYKQALAAFDRSLNEFELDYLDLFLMQWPASKGEATTWQSINAGTWRALEEIYASGRVRAIGVSNFLPHHLVPLLARAKVPPMVNQLEVHPGYPQHAAVKFCQEHGIQVVSWSPLARGALLRHPVIAEMAERHHVSPAQIALRWCLQHGVAALPKSTNPEHQKQNADLFSFSLTAEDMERLDTLPQSCFSGLDPDHVTF